MAVPQTAPPRKAGTAALARERHRLEKSVGAAGGASLKFALLHNLSYFYVGPFYGHLVIILFVGGKCR